MGHKVFLAIDNSNLYHAIYGNGHRLNYEVLLSIAQQMGILVEAAIYTTRHRQSIHAGNKSFLLALKRMGFTKVVARRPRELPEGGQKADTDVYMALDIWEAVHKKKVDVVILASGDGDFRPLVERLVQRNVTVYVIGAKEATAWELVVQATEFWGVDQLKGFVVEKDALAAVSLSSDDTRRAA